MPSQKVYIVDGQEYVEISFDNFPRDGIYRRETPPPPPANRWAKRAQFLYAPAPTYEWEKVAAKAAKKAANRRDWAPVAQWKEMAAPQLSFYMPPRECVDNARPAPDAPWIQWAFYHERAGSAFMRIAGLVMPAANGHFFQYQQKEGESRKKWRSRLHRMRKAQNWGKKVCKDSGRLDLPLFEQIRRLAQTANTLKNRYSVLQEVKLNEQIFGLRLIKKVKEAPKQRAFGPKTNFSFNYINERLALKAKRAELQDEWYEARCLRREKLARVVEIKDHRVISLKSQMLHLADQVINEQRDKLRNELLLEGQMNEPGKDAHGDAEESVTTTSTVEIHQQAGTSVGSVLPGGSVVDTYDQLSAASSLVRDEVFHDRFYTIKEITWQNNSARGSTIADIQVPKDIFSDPDFRQSPNYAVFSRHMYWKGDIEFKILINSNIRQYGQIQWSFYYGEKQDVFFEDLRNNIYSASQRLHALTTANFSNEVILKVPFEYVFPIMAINRVRQDGYKTLGRLIGKVIIPITSISGTSNFASIKILVRFLDNKFSGLVGQAIAEAQMFSLASVIAVKSLLDNNRDAPTVISPGVPVIPINTSSWCYGTGASTYNNVLRLNPNQVLPYESGRIPAIDEMTVNHIKRQFGMIGIVEWKADYSPGKLLFSQNAEPLSTSTTYPKLTFNNELVAIIPPVGVLSSLFAYWRGSLEIRIDIVGATDVSGALLAAYVPRYCEKDKVTMKQMYSCAHSIFEFKENRQMVFTIPYVASQMFWPRYQTLSVEHPSNDPPGCVYFFVYNQLIMNSTVPQEVQLILYLRAGDDFEVSIPASPSLGLGFNPKIYVEDTLSKRVVPMEGYVPTYSGSWRYAFVNLNGSFKALEDLGRQVGYSWLFDQEADIWSIPVMRYGAVSDHITLFRCVNFNLDPGCAVLCKIENVESGECIVMDNTTTKRYSITHLLVKEEGGYLYATPLALAHVPDATILVNYIKSLGVEERKHFNLWMIWMNAVQKTQKFTTRGNPKINPIDAAYLKPRDFYCSIKAPPVIQVSAQAGDEGSSIVVSPSCPQATAMLGNASSRVFGESFLDLKDLCRRFQLYASDQFDISKVLSTSHWRTITLRFPVLPQGLDLNIGDTASVREYWNRTREGPIPLIASGFRFFTGGLRFRICISLTKKNNKGDYLHGKLFVQHRPDVISNTKRVTISSGVSLGTDDLELPGYAAYHQFDNINNVLSVEVPFYRPSLRTYLQRPSNVDLAQRFSDLGELVVGITVFSYEPIKFLYDIYYSLADDARYSVFVGFPPMIDISNIPNLDPDETKHAAVEVIRQIEAAPSFVEEDIDSLVNKYNEVREKLLKRNIDIPASRGFERFPFSRMQSVLKYAEDKLMNSAPSVKLTPIMGSFENIHLEGQMFKSFSTLMGKSDKLEKTIDHVENIAEQIDGDLINDIKETSSNVKTVTETLKNLFTSDENENCVSAKFKRWTSVIINAITNICHVMLNCNLKAIGVAIISFLVQVKAVCFSVTSALADGLSKMFTLLVSRQPKLESIEGQMADSHSEKEEKDCIISGYISTAFAGVCALFSFVPKLCKSKAKDFASILMDGLTKFSLTANSLFRFIKNNLACMKHMGEYLFSNHPSVKKLGFLREHSDIHDWASKVVEMTDPRKEFGVFTSAKKASEAYLLAGQASVLQIKMLDLNLTSPQCNIINNLVKKIHDLRDRLAKSHTAPPVRFEPYIFELYGKTGIGKSELLKGLPYELFNYCGMKHEGELIYHRQVGNAYWNNLRNQPVCVIDEKFPVDGPGFSDVQMAELFQLKSSCVFNPPMADIPDKNIRYNPLLVLYASNSAFPEFNTVRDKKALWRRRDALIEVACTENWLTTFGADAKYSQIKEHPDFVAGDFTHLRFRFHRDVTNNNVGNDAWDGWLTYSEFKQQICNRFKRFFVEEEKKYRKEINRMKTILPEETENSTLSELFDYKWLEQFEAENPRFNLAEKQFHERYNRDLKFSDKKEIFELKLKISFLELFGGNPDEIHRCINKIYEIETSNRPSTSTVEGQMGDEKDSNKSAISPPIVWNPCVHYALRDQMEVNIGAVTWKDELNSFELEITEEDQLNTILMCMTGGMVQSFTWSKLYEKLNSFNNGMVYNPEKHILLFPYTTCIKNENCQLNSIENRRQYITELYFKKPEVNARLRVGQSLAEFVPKEILEGMGIKVEKIKEHKAIVEKLPEVKSWWAKLKESFYEIKWSSWLKKMAIALAIFSFLGAAIGLWTGRLTTVSAETSTLMSAGAVASGCAVRLDNQESYAALCDEVTTIIGQGHVSGDNKTNKQNTTERTNPAGKVVSALVKPVSQMGVCQWESVSKKLRRNTFFLDYSSDKVPRNPARCIGICGRYALIVDHYFDAWSRVNKRAGEDDMLFIPCIDGRCSNVKVRFSELKYRPISNSSLGILELPRIPNFKDIRNLFCSKDQHKYMNKRGSMVNLGVGNLLISLEAHDVDFEYYKDCVDVKGGDLWDSFQVHTAYEYYGFSQKGNCGSLLLAHGMQSPIVGMHVAGVSSQNWGLSEAVYSEMFDCLGYANAPSPVEPVGEGLTSKWYVDGEVIAIGKVPAKFAHQEKGKSRIVYSELQLKDRGNEFKIYTAPSVMSNHDQRIQNEPFSPMLEGCKHHGKPLRNFDPLDVVIAVEDLKMLILSKCKPQRISTGLLTIDEAIGGFESKPGYEHIEFSTSEGFPFVGMRPKGACNKRWLFNFDEDNKYVSCNDLLLNTLKVKWQQRLQNLIPSTVFTDCLKDCTVSLEKVLVPGKTRIFSMAPVDFTIQERQCTLDFVVSYMSCRQDLEHMIGCNPDSFEWTVLATKLLKKGSSIITGDYSKYGDSLPFEFISGAFDIIQAWYRHNGCIESELFQQLKIMQYEIGNSLHLMFDHIYQVVCGQPSGNSLTVILNSIANSLYIRVAYLGIMRNTEYCSLKDFHDNVCLYSYGDDLICSVSDKLKDRFNACSLHDFFASYGLKFTNANKTEEIIPYTLLSQAEFLKRGFENHPFRKIPRVVLAPLKIESIEDTVNWVWKESYSRSDPNCPTFREMSLQVCQDSLRNAFGRGPEYYQEWAKRLACFWMNLGVHFKYDLWEQMEVKIFDFNLDLSPYHKWSLKLPK